MVGGYEDAVLQEGFGVCHADKRRGGGGEEDDGVGVSAALVFLGQWETCAWSQRCFAAGLVGGATDASGAGSRAVVAAQEAFCGFAYVREILIAALACVYTRSKKELCTVGLIPRSTLFRSPIFRSPL